MERPIAMPGASDIPPGFLGNLSAEQETCLKQMWILFLGVADKGEDAFDSDSPAGKADRLASQKVVKELGGARFTELFWASAAYEHPDGIMLRFLRARKWDVNKAFAKFADMIKFRVDFDVDALVAKGDVQLNSDPGFVLQLKSGKAYMHGTDKRSRLVIYVHVRVHLPSEQEHTSVQTFCIYVMETCRLLFTPPTHQLCLVFDLTNFGLRNMDWPFIKFFNTVFEAYYPESLGVVLMHNAPWIFQTLWRAIRPLLDPVVQEKIAFTNSKTDLCQYIDEEHLPKVLEGGDNWEWNYTGPIEGEDTRFLDEAERSKWQVKRTTAQAAVLAATRAWVSADSDPDDTRGQRDEALLAYQIVCIEASPYLRPRNVHDRQGNLQEDGTVIWKYSGVSDAEKLGTPVDALRASLSDLQPLVLAE